MSVLKSNYGYSAKEILEAYEDRYIASITGKTAEHIRASHLYELIDEFIKPPFDAFAFWEMFVAEMVLEKLKFPFGKQQSPIVAYNIPNLQPSEPKSEGLLWDLKTIVSTDEMRPALTGVHQSKDDFVEATDTHILVKIKGSITTHPNDSWRGRTLNLKRFLETKGRVLEEIDERYPDFSAVIRYKSKVKLNVDVYALYNFAYGMNRIAKLFSAVKTRCIFKVQSEMVAVDAVLLEAICAFWLKQRRDTCVLGYDAANRAIMLEFENGNIGVIMPVWFEDKFIEQAQSPSEMTSIKSGDDFICSKPFDLNAVSQRYSRAQSGVKSPKPPKTTSFDKAKVVTSPADTYSQSSDKVSNSLLDALLQNVSSGTIASVTDFSDYRDIEKVRAEAIALLEKEGDKEFSFATLQRVLLKAKEIYLKEKPVAPAKSYESNDTDRIKKEISDLQGLLTLTDTTFIPSTDIMNVILKKGQLVEGNEIIGGVYTAKKTFNLGGAMMAAQAAKDVAPKSMDAFDERMAEKVRRKSFWERMQETGNEPNA